ncbi:MAG: membrane protein insertion efficiency factor YidD [Dokdonella sp.]
MTHIFIQLLRLYQRWLSPLLGSRCRFHPSCSSYARVSIARFGALRGGWLAMLRILRCQPLCTGGNDPVPEQFHWLRTRSIALTSPPADE